MSFNHDNIHHTAMASFDSAEDQWPSTKNGWTVNLSQLQGNFQQNGIYNLTTLTITWNEPNNGEYQLDVSIGGDEPVNRYHTFNKNNILREDVVLNGRWNKDIISFTIRPRV